MYLGAPCYGYAILSIWQYQGHVRYARKRLCLFCLYATAKSQIQNCSNKHETGLVHIASNLFPQTLRFRYRICAKAA